MSCGVLEHPSSGADKLRCPAMKFMNQKTNFKLSCVNFLVTKVFYSKCEISPVLDMAIPLIQIR